MKILLAEDEDDLREVTSAFLELKGYTVDTAQNGDEAVEKAGMSAYDAIVMDIMMPVKDGISAMKELRAKGDTTPAIFLTAKTEVSDRIEGLDAGADDYLTKPFSMDELSARLRALYRRKREYRLKSMTFGNVELDTETAQLKAGNSIGLAVKEVRLMEFLLSNTDRELSTEEILREVWEQEGAGTEVVWMYISFLQAKLKSINADIRIDGEKNGSFRIRKLTQDEASA